MHERLPVMDRRRAGVLLHPTALSDDTGRGGLGDPALRFIDWLAEGGFTVWQVLPLGPTGADGSPYWARSDQAGNPRLLDPHWEPPGGEEAFRAWCAAEAGWLEDYVLFESISRSNRGTPWWEWPPSLRDREPAALDAARRVLAAPMEQLRRGQWCFAAQWQRLRAHAHARGVRLFGDLPIYVAPDSVAVWAQREQFRLDAQGLPVEVAGVPPDYFSADGQLWGNPLYDWTRHRADGFSFWRARVAAQWNRFDLVRLDHFRGLCAHWAVPFGALTARDGLWRETPGPELLQALRRDTGHLPLVAEDLGIITPDVEELRRSFELPGMRVLQFAFGGDARNPHLPHNHSPDCVVYTGTHDNDTTRGWLSGLEDGARRHLQDYLDLWDEDAIDMLVRAALSSVGRLAVLPMQDLLQLGSEARFNRPGTVAGNWQWRLDPGALEVPLARRHRELNELYGRCP
ncbi:MAG: hypothetical protein RL026_2414 [Pseudomonadota bacterium]|jgi:4-alpha-glucanotransferase